MSDGRRGHHCRDSAGDAERRRPEQSLQRDDAGQGEPGPRDDARTRLRAASEVERRLRHRSGHPGRGRSLQGRYEPAARGALVGFDHSLGDQQCRGPHGRDADPHRSGDREARQAGRRRRSVQHVLHAGRPLRRRRGGSVQAPRLSRPEDDGAPGLSLGAAMRGDQPRRLLDRRPLSDHDV